MDAVDRLTCLIQECGGKNCLECLQNHKIDQIRKTADDLLDQYFTDQEDQEEVVLQPETSSNGASYQFNAHSISDGRITLD